MATDCVGFQAQIASIVEILANSAVAEICKLVEEGYEALRSQMERERVDSQRFQEESERENDALRLKLRQMDAKVRSYERKMRRRSNQQLQLLRQEQSNMHAAHFRPEEVPEDIVPVTVGEEGQTFQHTSMEVEDVVSVIKEEQMEKNECNLDLKVEVNIRADCEVSNAVESNEEAFNAAESTPAPSSTDSTIDLTCRPRAKRKSTKPVANLSPNPAENCSLHPDIHVIDDADDDHAPHISDDHAPHISSALNSEETSPERLSSLALDLAWMQERVTHLGAAYAVAQLGLGNSDSGHGSFPGGQGGGGGDGSEGPPTMIFPSSAHEMAAFAASFDISGVQNSTGPPAPPPTPNHKYSVKEAAACNVCGRVFPSAATLELHQRVHTGERPYTCAHCGKGFAQPNNLRVHLLIHTGERRYRCTLCGKSFISSSHLKRHRTVHTQEKPYSCSMCGQAFSQMCSVRRHRQQSQCGLLPGGGGGGDSPVSRLVKICKEENLQE